MIFLICTLSLSFRNEEVLKLIQCISYCSFQRSRTIRVCVCVCVEREKDFKAHMITETGKSKICRAGWQAGEPGNCWYLAEA